MVFIRYRAGANWTESFWEFEDLLPWRTSTI